MSCLFAFVLLPQGVTGILPQEVFPCDQQIATPRTLGLLPSERLHVLWRKMKGLEKNEGSWDA